MFKSGIKVFIKNERGNLIETIQVGNETEKGISTLAFLAQN